MYLPLLKAASAVPLFATFRNLLAVAYDAQGATHLQMSSFTLRGCVATGLVVCLRRATPCLDLAITAN
jgi:hypothetical protein